MKEWSNAALYVVAIIVFIITLSLYFKLKSNDWADEFATYCESAAYDLLTGDSTWFTVDYRTVYGYSYISLFWTVLNDWIKYGFECRPNRSGALIHIYDRGPIYDSDINYDETMLFEIPSSSSEK